MPWCTIPQSGSNPIENTSGNPHNSFAEGSPEYAQALTRILNNCTSETERTTAEARFRFMAASGIFSAMEEETAAAPVGVGSRYPVLIVERDGTERFVQVVPEAVVPATNGGASMEAEVAPAPQQSPTMGTSNMLVQPPPHVLNSPEYRAALQDCVQRGTTAADRAAAEARFHSMASTRTFSAAAPTFDHYAMSFQDQEGGRHFVGLAPRADPGVATVPPNPTMAASNKEEVVSLQLPHDTEA